MLLSVVLKYFDPEDSIIDIRSPILLIGSISGYAVTNIPVLIGYK
jgi:hypothetical protein